jgi:hypothetical protein
VAVVRTNASEEDIANIIRVTRIGDLGTISAGTNHCISLQGITNYMREESIELDTKEMGG